MFGRRRCAGCDARLKMRFDFPAPYLCPNCEQALRASESRVDHVLLSYYLGDIDAIQAMEKLGELV